MEAIAGPGRTTAAAQTAAAAASGTRIVSVTSAARAGPGAAPGPGPAGNGTQRLSDSFRLPLAASDEEPDLGDNKYLFKTENLANFKANFNRLFSTVSNFILTKFKINICTDI